MAGKSQKVDKNAIKGAIVYLQNLIGSGKILPTDIMPQNPGMNTALNMAAAIPNSIYGQGIIAPTNDITRNAMNLIQGQQPVPYDQLQSGATKLGYQAGNAINPMEGIPQDLLIAGGNTAQGAAPILDAAAVQSAYGLIKNAGGQGKALVDAYKEAGQAPGGNLGQIQLHNQAAMNANPLSQLDRAFQTKDPNAPAMAQQILSDPALKQYWNSASGILKMLQGGHF